MSESSCPRCGVAKRPVLFSCARCWRELPNAVRREIGDAYRQHGAMSAEWGAAARRAFEAWGIEVPRWVEVAEERE